MINIWYKNLVDTFGNVISASSAATGFPAVNVSNNQPTVIWLSGTSLTKEWVLVDMGAAVAVTDFICAFHNLTSGDSALTLQYGNVATTGIGGLTTPAGTQSLTWTAGPIQKSFSTQTYRYFCFVFTKSSSSQSRQIGRIYLGTVATVNPPDFDTGVTCIRQDLSLVNTARSGQDYGILKPSKRLWTLTWTQTPASDFTTLDAVYYLGGKVLKFFMQIDSNSGDPRLNVIAYVRFSDDFQTADVDALDSSQCWGLSCDWLEQI